MDDPLNDGVARRGQRTWTTEWPVEAKVPNPLHALYDRVSAGQEEAVKVIAASLAAGYSPESLPADSGSTANRTTNPGLLALEARVSELAQSLADSPLKAHLEWQTDKDGDRKLVVLPRPPRPDASAASGNGKKAKAVQSTFAGERIIWGSAQAERYGRRYWVLAKALPRETEKAILAMIGGGPGVWLPKSQVHVFQRADQMFAVCVRDWFAKKLNIERMPAPEIGQELLPIV